MAWVGYLSACPVATAASVTADGVIGLYNVATAPAFRKRGFGEAIARHTIADAEQASRCGWTPFDGMQAKGWPMATIIRGHIVMRDDEVVVEGSGEPVKFVETLEAQPA